MGGQVSSGEDNDELTDNLVQSKYIVSKTVENVFRTVDRGMYYPPDERKAAYAVSYTELLLCIDITYM